MFVIILILILAIMYFNMMYNPKLNLDTFNHTNYPYNPIIKTPQTNYNKIISQIDSQQIYKSDLSVAFGPTPTIKCPELKNKSECNKYGCNWYKTFCSSTYPTQI